MAPLPPRWVASYKAVYTFKCAASALATCSLALLSNYVFTRGTDFAKAFAVYFMFDSTFDLGMDLTFRPPRKTFELVMLAHHVLGVYTMYTMPETPQCLAVMQWITVGETTSPFLYLSLYWKTVRDEEPPHWVSIVLLAMWPCARFVPPALSFYLQYTSCYSLFHMLTTVGYIAMNIMFFSKLLKRYLRRRESEKKGA